MKIFHYNDEEQKLHEYLGRRGHENVILPSRSDPFSVVRPQVFDAAFVGLHPHGLRLIQALHQRNVDCLVTIITSDRNTRMAVEAMKGGAFDYLISPLDFSEVERTCILMARERQMHQERRQLQDQLADVSSNRRLVGNSEPMRNLRRLIAKAAASRAPVLITGETGTGKELIAQMLHELSPRSGAPFVSINCNAIPTTLLESELFGYKQGAFTGADTDRLGLLSQANGGTFFLDEIADLDHSLQGKILRVLQEGEILPLGGGAVERLDVRFIASTNKNLDELISGKEFREDLYFRLNVVPIHAPPLRAHLEDVAPLTRHFIERYCREEGRTPLRVSSAVWRWMSHYHWPGNVRELENLCQRAVALTDTDSFDTNVLALTDSFGRTGEMGATASSRGGGLGKVRERLERSVIERALADHDSNVSRAAKSLGISRTTFYAKARKLSISLPRQQLKRGVQRQVDQS